MKSKQFAGILDWECLSEVMGFGVPTKHAGVDRCLDFMAECFPKPIQVKDLAQAAGMSTQGLSFIFDKHLGVSPGEVLRRIRIECAKRLLVEQDMKLSEIAKHCGYRSVNSLWIAFQNATGMSPKKFQTKYWLATCRNQKQNGFRLAY